MADRIQQRRDTAARWAQYNPVLLEGEVGYVTDNPNQYKIGDGVHTWNELPLRGYTGTIVQDTGYDENAVMSQKVTTEKLTELEHRLSFTDLMLRDKKTYHIEVSTTESKSYVVPLSFNSGYKVKFKMSSDVAVSQAYLGVTYNGSNHNLYIGSTYEIEFDNDNSTIDIWVSKSMFSQNGTLNIEIEAIESINKDIEDLQERVGGIKTKIITPETISDVNIINESQTYTITGSETAGKFIEVEKQFIGNSPIICTLTCTNNCLSQGKDIVITYADGSTEYVIRVISINTDYEITPTKEVVSIKVYAELARMQGTGDVTLTIRDKNSNERKINALDTRVTSTEKNISVLELKDFGLHKTYETSVFTSTSYNFEINEYLPKGTSLKFRMSTESGVLIDGAFLGVDFGEGTKGNRYVNNDYTVELADDTNQINIWVAKSMVVQDGVMTVSIDVEGINNTIDNNAKKLNDILLSTTLNSDWMSCTEEIQKAHDKKFVMCIQTDTHFNFVNPDKYYVKDASHANNLKLLGATVGADCIINLGDLIEGYLEDELADMRISMTEAVKRYCYPKFCPALFAIGNHDDNSMHGIPYMSIDEVYGRIFKPMLQTSPEIVLGEGMYYYIDFDDVRVIVLNTQDSDSNLQIFKISAEQANWFTNTALNTTKHIIVASHCPLITELSEEADSSFTSIVSAINSFVRNGGKCIACIAGHTHQQDSYVKDGINYVVFAHYGFRSETMIVDTVNHSVVTKCAGSGISNRTWNY